MNLLSFLLLWFKANGKAVLFSVLGASTFWFFNAMNKSYSTRVNYPIAYSYAEDSLVVMHPLPKTVEIDVTGNGWDILRQTLGIDAAPIDIPLHRPKIVRRLKRADLIPMVSSHLNKLSLDYVVTDTLFFDVEERATKTLPLRVDSLSVPLTQLYRIVSPVSCNIDSVVVSGPKSTLRKMKGYVMVRFDESNIDQDFEEAVGYDVPDYVEVEPQNAVVSFEVAKFVVKQLSIPLEKNNFPKDSSVYLAAHEVALQYTDREDREPLFNPVDFQALVNYKKRNRKDSTITPILTYVGEREPAPTQDKSLRLALVPDRFKLSYAPKP